MLGRFAEELCEGDGDVHRLVLTSIRGRKTRCHLLEKQAKQPWYIVLVRRVAVAEQADLQAADRRLFP